MGHSSPKLIASQRLTVSLHPPFVYPLPVPLFPPPPPPPAAVHSTPCPASLRTLYTLSISISHSLTLFLRVYPSSPRVTSYLCTYIVPPNNTCSKGRETTDSRCREPPPERSSIETATPVVSPRIKIATRRVIFLPYRFFFFFFFLSPPVVRVSPGRIEPRTRAGFLRESVRGEQQRRGSLTQAEGIKNSRAASGCERRCRSTRPRPIVSRQGKAPRGL